MTDGQVEQISPMKLTALTVLILLIVWFELIHPGH